MYLKISVILSLLSSKYKNPFANSLGSSVCLFGSPDSIISNCVRNGWWHFINANTHYLLSNTLWQFHMFVYFLITTGAAILCQHNSSIILPGSTNLLNIICETNPIICTLYASHVIGKDLMCWCKLLAIFYLHNGESNVNCVH